MGMAAVLMAFVLFLHRIVPAELQSLDIAVCLTGQLARLELISKIRNVFIPNAILGHRLHIFTILDDNVTDVKQTFWRFDYSDNVYGNMNSTQLRRFMRQTINDSLSHTTLKAYVANIAIRPVKLQPPARKFYAVRGKKIPVTDKSGPNDPYASPVVEPADIRFQNNMRWLTTMRECVKDLQAFEIVRKKFFDIVIRMRDDSYALRPWLIDPVLYKKRLVSTNLNVHFGINDHNFAIDREWADIVLRGVTEDYYFNKSLDIYSWVNPERRIYKVSSSNNVPMLTTPFCEHPLIPLRGKFNRTHWRVHVSYAEKVLDNCLGSEYVNYKIESGIIVRSVTSPSSRGAKSKRSKITDTRKLADEVTYQEIMSIYTRGSRSKTRSKSHAEGKKSHRGGIGTRRINASVPFTKVYLEQLLMANRQLTMLELQKKATERDLQSCCNDALFQAMRSQAVPIERVHFMINK